MTDITPPASLFPHGKESHGHTEENNYNKTQKCILFSIPLFENSLFCENQIYEAILQKKDSFFLELKIKCKQILGGIFKGAAESEVHQTDTRARKMAELVM
jgi:hypothetical protein